MVCKVFGLMRNRATNKKSVSASYYIYSTKTRIQTRHKEIRHEDARLRSQVIGLKMTLALLFLFTMQKSDFRDLIKQYFLIRKN